MMNAKVWMIRDEYDNRFVALQLHGSTVYKVPISVNMYSMLKLAGMPATVHPKWL